MVHPMFKQIDWNTIAETWWTIIVSAVTATYCWQRQDALGYITGGLILLTFFVMGFTTKKTPEERQAIIDLAKGR